MNNLLVFSENYVRGGGNRYLIDTVNAVGRLFARVILVSNPGGIFAEDLSRLNIPVILDSLEIFTRTRFFYSRRELPQMTGKTALLFLKLLEPALFLYNVYISCALLRRRNPSAVLVCNGGYPGGHAALAMVVAAKCMNVPVLMSIVSTPMPRKILSWPYECLVDQLVWNSADKIIVNAHSIVNELHLLRGMPVPKAVTVYNGLDEKTPVSAVTNREKNEIIVGCIARMDLAKGVLNLLEAFLRLSPRYPQLKLVLVGTGDASGELQNRVASFGLSGRVQLLGQHDGDIDGLLAGFDMYVFPSLQEGFPYSILEAMRAGCAIISTDVGGISEAIRDGTEGLLVRPASVEALESGMKRLINDCELRRKLGAGARERFAKEFTLDGMTMQLRKVFFETLSGRTGHAE